MSETVSYSARALSGKPRQVVLENLNKRGIFLRDFKGWATARERAEDLHAKLQEELHRLSSMSLGDSRDSLPKRDYIRPEAMLKAFCGVPAFKAYAEKMRAKELEDLKEGILLLQEESLNPYKGMYSPLQFQERIELLATDVQRELCQVEKEALLGAASDALADLGYSLECNGDALKATMNRSCIWLEANALGEVSLDFSGFSGISCLEEVRRAEDALAEKGIILSRTSSDFHGRPEGGVLTGNLESLFPVFKRMNGKHSQVTPCRPRIKIGG